jgi:hypothetical protein
MSAVPTRIRGGPPGLSSSDLTWSGASSDQLDFMRRVTRSRCDAHPLSGLLSLTLQAIALSLLVQIPSHAGSARS